MASPLEGALASAIYKGLKGIFLDATLTQDTFASVSPDVAFDPANPTQTSYTCKAVNDKTRTFTTPDGLVSRRSASILILANSLSVTPTDGDRVTIRSKTYRIGMVEIDPAQACWICEVRA